MLYPDRRELARRPARVLRGGSRSTAADHGVTEAVYLRDPDGNGVELYCDRPREQWPRPGDGEGVAMHNAPFDLQALLREAQ